MIIKPPENFLLKNIITDFDFYKNNEINIDECLVDEIKNLWNKGVHTIGCCCGHQDTLPKHIMVERTDYKKMLDLGYDMYLNQYGNVCFVPKSKCICDKKKRC